MRTAELHPMLVPAALRVPWDPSECPIPLFSYLISLLPLPCDRDYRPFGLFLRSRLPAEAETIQVQLHLAKRRIVRAGLVPSGPVTFDREEMIAAEGFQEMCLKILLDRVELHARLVPLGKGVRDNESETSTFYLLLPVVEIAGGERLGVDWGTIRRCLSSPVFRGSVRPPERGDARVGFALQLSDGSVAVDDVLGSLVFCRKSKAFFFVHGIAGSKQMSHSNRTARQPPQANKNEEEDEGEKRAEHGEKRWKGKILYPEQPILHVKRLFTVRNLLLNTLRDTAGKKEVVGKKEHFLFLPPEICSIKILGFAKDIGSTLSLLPSFMCRLQNILVAIELKATLSASFSEGSTITATRVLEALTAEECLESMSFERLEFLGDAFLKYTISQHGFLMNESLDEGQLTDRRRDTVNNLHLYELAVGRNLQVYIHNEYFAVSQFFALGRPCRLVCPHGIDNTIHRRQESDKAEGNTTGCNKSHRWLYRETVSDVVEALVGACLIDAGFTAAISFLKWLGIPAGFEYSDVYKIMQSSERNLWLINSTDICGLEDALSYTFHNKGVLLEALLHPSFSNHSVGSYQRLEFLGDAALDYLITSYIFSSYPDLDPGKLSILRSIAVSNSALPQVAIKHRLHLYLIKNSIVLTEAIKKFETFVCMLDSDEGFLEEPPFPKVLADIVESCFGAILLDTCFDLNRTWRIFLTLLAPILSFDNLKVNPIRELRELCPGCEIKKLPLEGKRLYKVEVKACVNDRCFLFSATNFNSNAATRMACEKALDELKNLGHKSKRKSLEETLASTRKGEARLIGFPERYTKEDCVLPFQTVQKQNMDPCIKQLPLDASVQLLADGLSSMKIKQPCKAPGFPSNLLGDRSKVDMKSNVITANGIERVDTMPNEVMMDARFTYDAEESSAKLRLSKICAVNNLRPPSFICCRENSPPSEEMFTCKATVKLERMATATILECFSDPKQNQISAEEQAAEGLLWYLKHERHLP